MRSTNAPLLIVHDWNYVKTVANDADAHWGTDADGCWARNFDVQMCWEVAGVVRRTTMRLHHVAPDSDEMEVKLHAFSSTKILLLANNLEQHLVMRYDCALKNGYSYTSTTHIYTYGENDWTARTHTQ